MNKLLMWQCLFWMIIVVSCLLHAAGGSRNQMAVVGAGLEAGSAGRAPLTIRAAGPIRPPNRVKECQRSQLVLPQGHRLHVSMPANQAYQNY